MVVNSLKKQVANLKHTIKSKEDEVEEYKNNSKVGKYKQLENELDNKLIEFRLLNQSYSYTLNSLKE